LADLFRHACVLSHRQGWVNLDEHRWVNFGERYSYFRLSRNQRGS